MSFMQCLLEILHSSTFYIAQADLPQGAISSKTHFGVNGLFFFKLSNSKSMQESNPLWGNYIIDQVLGLFYNAPYFLVKVFLTKKVCFIQLI